MTKEELYSETIKMLPVVNTDNKDFRSLLSETLKRYMGLVSKTDGIDNDLQKEVSHICDTIKEIVKSQYKGLHAQAFKKLQYLFTGTKYYNGLSGKIPYSTLKANTSLFRARVNNTYNKFTYKDMFHIPFDKRGIVQTQRYSFPGYPCLYVGESIYACWEEMHRVDFDLCMVSRIENQRDIKLLDLKVPTKDEYDGSLEAILLRFPLIIACMIVVQNRDDVFKPEYIIPQLLTEWVITYNSKHKDDFIYGIRYTSSLTTDEFGFPKSKINNIAFFPINILGNSIRYCPKLADIFRITDPTCNEFEKLKGGYADDKGLCDLKGEEILLQNYKLSDFGGLEENLKDNKHFPLNKIKSK